MNAAEREAFLTSDDPPWVAAVATVDEAGAPHAVSAWYRWDGTAFHLWSVEGLRWQANLRRDPRVALVVFEHEPPLRAVYAKGRALLRTGPMEALLDHVRPIVARYEADPDETIARYTGPEQVAITVVPDSLVGKTND